TMLVDRTKLSKPSVLAALVLLVLQGYAEALGSSRQRLYRLDARHPLAPALSALFAAEEGRFNAVLDAIGAAASDAGATAAWLYGSVATGQDGPHSDVDVVVVAGSEDCEAVAMKVRDRLRETGDRLRFSAAVVCLASTDVMRLARE